MPVLPALFAILLLAQFGCEEDSSRPDPVEPYQLILLGSYADDEQGDQGVILLDLEFAGAELTGHAVIKSRVNESPLLNVYLKGSSDGDDIQLDLDKEKIPYQYELTITATMGTGHDLTGTFSYPLGDLEAEFQAVTLETADAAVDTLVDLDVSTSGLAFDGEDIWVSTVTKDHILMNLDCAFVDTIAVFIRDAHWTSDALTSDGTHLWGHLPVTVQGGGEVRNESDIQKFTKEGVIIDSFRIPFRATGLAHDGEYLWSLAADSGSLIRFDDQGTILESIELGLPDLVDIEYDGVYFWGIGWFMKRLYRIDSEGRVLRVYHLPGETGIIFPSAIVFDGEQFWYAFNTSYLDSRIYKMTVGL
jgi:hypothetical protein